MTVKRKKETERKHILSVSLKVSDIGSSHCTASAERGWFVEHPFKATAEPVSLPLCSNHLNKTNIAYLLEYGKKSKENIKWSKYIRGIL